MRKLEIYLHIPFCAKKCAYCDFLSAPAGREQQKAYVQALKEEIHRFANKEKYEVSSVFFGGGTPSLLPAAWIAELMEIIKTEFCVQQNAEITIECNPGTVDAEKLKTYGEAGINRISFGLQSADNRELELLGRIHTWEDFRNSYEMARCAGFSNINIDLMSALPGQTTESWERTLRRVLALDPRHISAYSLIIEEGTPFYERYQPDAEKRERGEQPELLPSEEDERQMYRLTEKLLKEAGMHRYEISNYALKGCECRHNMGYWDGTEYIGFGLGASSMLADVSGTYVRRKNTEDMRRYLERDFRDREKLELSIKDRMEEFMFLGLRMMCGVSEREFAERFGKSIDSVYGPVLKKQQEAGLMERRNGQIALTGRGIDLSNAVMAEFLLD